MKRENSNGFMALKIVPTAEISALLTYFWCRPAIYTEIVTKSIEKK
jgi:hypothetical protein